MLIAERLARSGFVSESMPFGDVANLWSRRGSEGPLLCFAGHTDVVPTGPLDKWDSAPFDPVVREGKLYGRGAADMKSSIAAFVLAVEAFVAERPRHAGSIAFLITSDEEGPSVDGTVRVVEQLNRRGERIDYCLVGEPSSGRLLGDTIRNGRRGSLSGKLTVRGVQGHVAYPEQVRNPILLLAPALAELAATQWDGGGEFFPPTSFQASNIHAGTGATNVVPGTLEMDFNFRFSTVSSADSLRSRTQAVLERHGIDYSIDWNLSGNPFLTQPGELVSAAHSAIRKVTGLETQLSTAGGTSDGRFIADICAQIVELGPVNASIHKLNENIDLACLEQLPRIYLEILRTLLR